MAITGDPERPVEPCDSDSDNIHDPSSPGTEGRRQSSDPVLPRRSSDERDLGWGDAPAEYDDEWYLAQRPPHHD